MEFNRDVQVRDEKFGTVIFETLKEKVFVTNTTGAEIVRLIQEKKTRDEIVAELSASYGLEAGAIAGDVDGFLGKLRTNEVVRPG